MSIVERTATAGAGVVNKTVDGLKWLDNKASDALDNIIATVKRRRAEEDNQEFTDEEQVVLKDLLHHSEQFGLQIKDRLVIKKPSTQQKTELEVLAVKLLKLVGNLEVYEATEFTAELESLAIDALRASH